MRGKTGKCMYRYIGNEKTGKTDILLPYILGWSDDDRREKQTLVGDMVERRE